MIYLELRKKLRDFINENATLLWLEGSQYEQVHNVQIKASKVVLTLDNGTIKIVQFDRYAFTSVGVQFWNKGRPGVLFKWNMPALSSIYEQGELNSLSADFPDDDPTPPDVAA